MAVNEKEVFVTSEEVSAITRGLDFYGIVPVSIVCLLRTEVGDVFEVKTAHPVPVVTHDGQSPPENDPRVDRFYAIGFTHPLAVYPADWYDRQLRQQGEARMLLQYFHGRSSRRYPSLSDREAEEANRFPEENEDNAESPSQVIAASDLYSSNATTSTP